MFKPVSIAATAGNVATAITPPAGHLYKIRTGHVKLDCDATAANRFILLKHVLVGGKIVATYASTAITANQNGAFGLFPITGLNGAPVLNTYLGLSLNVNLGVYINEIVLYWGDEIQVVIDAGVAGDSYSGEFQVEDVTLN